MPILWRIIQDKNKRQFKFKDKIPRNDDSREIILRFNDYFIKFTNFDNRTTSKRNQKLIKNIDSFTFVTRTDENETTTLIKYSNMHIIAKRYHISTRTYFATIP